MAESVAGSGTETPDRGARHTAFRVIGWSFFVFLYLFSPATSVILGWFVDFEDNISHRVHEVTFGVLFVLVMVGIASQLRAPSRHIAGMQQAVVLLVLFTAVVTASTGWEWTALMYLVPVGALVVLHPSRRHVIDLRPRIEPGLARLMLLATYPFLLAFLDEFGKAANEVRGHQAHWGGVAAFALGLFVVGWFAATRQAGWQVSAWSVSFATIVFGVASMVFRFDASARTDARAVVTIIWGILFAFYTRRAQLQERTLQETEPLPESTETPRRERLTRRSEGRLVGGVASGLAVRVGWSVWAVRGILVALFAVPVLLGDLLVLWLVYAVAWVALPLDDGPSIVGRILERIENLPRWARFLALPLVPFRTWRRRRSRFAGRLVAGVMVGIGAAVTIGAGVFVYTAADGFTAPPVPHDIESRSEATCVVCHVTGQEFAPVINPFTHNFYSDFRDQRNSVPFCGECHDLPAVSTPSAHRGWGMDIGSVTPLADSQLSAVATALIASEPGGGR